MSLRVLFVSQYFPPETGAAPARAYAFCGALAAAGHKVTVVTGMPNHPSGTLRSEYRRRFFFREEILGCDVRRAWLYVSPRRRTIDRLLNQLTFAVGVLLRGPWIGADVVVVTIPPTFAGTVSSWIARGKRVPFIVDVRDDWPRAAIRLGHLRDGRVARVLQVLADRIYGQADRLVLVTPGMVREFERRGTPAGAMALVTNGVEMDRFPPRGETTENEGSRIEVVYAGTHGLVHGMDAILDAASELSHSEYDIRLIGDGAVKEALMQRAESEGLLNVSFESSRSSEEIAEVLSRATIGLVTTCADEFCGETIPVKLFDYMAASLPVVGALRGDAADILERSGAGIVVSPESGREIADAIRRFGEDPEMRQQMGRVGREFVSREYDRKDLADRFASTVASSEGSVVSRHARPDVPYAVLKRLADVFLSLVGLIILSPVLLAIGVYIRIESHGPALFRQRRSGRWSREFVMLKFRTMRVETPDVATHLLEDSEQFITRSGGILRMTSFDELPQLWNVLIGDMSLVGPRPALYNQYDLIGMRRLENVDTLRPGVTGWAQVNGRDDLPMDVKVRYDAEYLAKISPGFDIVCLWRTMTAVFSRRGAR